MDLDTLKTKEKDASTSDQLIALYQKAKHDHAKDLALDTLLYLADVYRHQRHHDETIKVLEEAIDVDFFTSKDARLKIIDELVKTLLITEDFIKLKSVLYSRERYLTNEHQKVMQKFYYAVCHEGMKDYHEAINYLLSIKDNISSTNLVSKYLKLSMLHLKENKLDQAKKYYDIALKFDPKKKNPIVHLALSDLRYAEGDYLQAMNEYQEYFIKSQNKRRYLDRYILINMKIGQLDEAWRFYQEYLPSVKQLVSKNYRLVFYEAGLLLAEKLGHLDEIQKLQLLIKEMTPAKPMLNQFDHIYRLLTLTFKKSTYFRERDILFDLFNALNSMFDFEKLVYLKNSEKGLKLYHLSKGLLLEKTPKITDISETLIEAILEGDHQEHLLTYDDLRLFHKALFKTVETQIVFCYPIARDSSDDYLIVYSKDSSAFDLEQKLVLLAHQILIKALYDLDQTQSLRLENDMMSSLIQRIGYGLVKIENNTMHLMNDAAKQLFNCQEEFLSFDVFQKDLQDIIYLDDLLYQEEMTVIFKHQPPLTFVISQAETSLYLLCYRPVQVTNLEQSHYFFDLPDLSVLMKSELDGQMSLMMIHIRDAWQYLKDYQSKQYQVTVQGLIETGKTLSRGHFVACYAEGLDSLYLLLRTTDKRVLKRISDHLLKATDAFDLRLSIMQLSQVLSQDKLIQLKSLNALTSSSQPVIRDSKNFRYNLELAKTLLINIDKYIQAKDIPLAYQPIGDWRDQKVHMLEVMVSDQAMLGEAQSLARVIKTAGRSNEWDLLIASSLIKKLKKQSHQATLKLPLFWDTWTSMKTIKQLLRKFEQANISPKQLVFHCQLDSQHSYKEMLESITYLHNKGCQVSVDHIIQSLKLDDFGLFAFIDYVEFTAQDLQRAHFSDLLQALKQHEISYIYHHGTETLKKSVLEAYEIDLVKGAMFAKYESGITTSRKDTTK